MSSRDPWKRPRLAPTVIHSWGFSTSACESGPDRVPCMARVPRSASVSGPYGSRRPLSRAAPAWPPQAPDPSPRDRRRSLRRDRRACAERPLHLGGSEPEQQSQAPPAPAQGSTGDAAGAGASSAPRPAEVRGVHVTMALASDDSRLDQLPRPCAQGSDRDRGRRQGRAGRGCVRLACRRSRP